MKTTSPIWYLGIEGNKNNNLIIKLKLLSSFNLWDPKFQTDLVDILYPGIARLFNKQRRLMRVLSRSRRIDETGVGKMKPLVAKNCHKSVQRFWWNLPGLCS